MTSLERQVQRAAQTGDRRRFRELAAQLPGGLARAHEIARSGLVTRQPEGATIGIVRGKGNGSADGGPRSRFASRDDFIAFLKKPPEPREVLLAWQARRLLGEQEYGDEFEVGGGLFGYQQGTTLVIGDVCGTPGAAHGRQRSTTTLDLDWFLHLEEQHRETTGWQWIGDWHSHPTFEGERAQPSKTDKRGWEGFYRPSVGVYVGLILSRSSDGGEIGWMYPRYSAWLTTRGQLPGRPDGPDTDTIIKPIPLRVQQDPQR